MKLFLIPLFLLFTFSATLLSQTNDNSTTKCSYPLISFNGRNQLSWIAGSPPECYQRP